MGTNDTLQPSIDDLDIPLTDPYDRSPEGMRRWAKSMNETYYDSESSSDDSQESQSKPGAGKHITD